MLAKYHMSPCEARLSQCSICFQPNFQLLQCQGSCLKEFCKNCARMRSYRPCPFCTQSLRIQYLPLKQVNFQCPACSALLYSQTSFQSHCRQCPILPVQLRLQYIYKAEYRCQKGHTLRFPLRKTNCSICYQYHYTSRCDPCDVQLCTTCRPPPCSRQECPLGHDFKYSPGGASVICDLCGISINEMNTKAVYGDRECNFDVCKNCYLKLPQKHPFPEYKHDKVITYATDKVGPYSRLLMQRIRLEQQNFSQNESDSVEQAQQESVGSNESKENEEESQHSQPNSGRQKQGEDDVISEKKEKNEEEC